jgi:putative ABC transport system permease protein
MLLKVAFRNLFRNPRRTAAILLTVGMGTGSLFIFHGFNAGVMNQYKENTIHAIYGHGQINTAHYRDQVYEKPWEHWITNYPELAASLKSIPGVRQIFPRVEFFALLTNGKVTVAGRGQGVDGPEEARFFTHMNVEQGKMLSDEPDGVLIGVGLARTLDARPGDRITVLANTVNGSMNGTDLTVTGIFHTGGKEFDDAVFRMPLAQAQTLLDTQRVESVALGLDSTDSWDSVADRIRDRFPGLEATPFAVLDEIYYQHSVDWLKSQFGIIQAIILLIVVLGIFNTVSIGVLERKQEIGNLRANGESQGDIIALLGMEGIALGICGALLGIALAWLANATLLRHGILMPPAPGITRQFHVWVELQWRMAITTFLMGTASALLGTLIAAIRVSRMPIGEALRSI